MIFQFIVCTMYSVAQGDEKSKEISLIDGCKQKNLQNNTILIGFVNT